MGWQMADLYEISPALCLHKIFMKEGHKPVAQPQRRLNHVMKDVVRKEIIKWLDACIIYLISYSKLVSPVQYVLEKGGMTVITNDKNELIPTKMITGWPICMDYRNLNDATRKDNYPVPFIDMMLDRFLGKENYCFLDGYSWYKQITIDLEDQ
ncbi:uncharacterized protein LOC129872337 [Solanum dulcamara]|uniref:uncharacterized protein LOC129872337 n=1 Tax=Solanum dulcamara TaxID=45834 RepID=UPI0024864D77|nr:uncharacterized protein LOC129872337 [Solanum dulcamara]